MIFLEIPDVELWQKELLAKELHLKYKYVKILNVEFRWIQKLV